MKLFSCNLQKWAQWLCAFLLCNTLALPASASHAEGGEGAIDVKDIVLGHMSDAYDWHIVTWNGHHISIPLPVIVRGEDGAWHVFSSARFHESADGVYEGFFLNEEDNGKIYERLADGSAAKPLNLSMTKDVGQIWIVVAIMAIVFLSAARWYKGRKPGDKAPGGFVGLVEIFVMSMVDYLIRPSVG